MSVMNLPVSIWQISISYLDLVRGYQWLFSSKGHSIGMIGAHLGLHWRCFTNVVSNKDFLDWKLLNFIQN